MTFTMNPFTANETCFKSQLPLAFFLPLFPHRPQLPPEWMATVDLQVKRAWDAYKKQQTILDAADAEDAKMDAQTPQLPTPIAYGDNR